MIWFKKVDIGQLNNRGQADMHTHLEIRFTRITDNSLEATMPVNEKTKQPYGILHGGASLALAETIGSVASSMVIDPNLHIVVGMSINANHLKPVRSGTVKAVCSPLHLGRSSHVWDVLLFNDQEQLICISRLTVAVLKKETFHLP